MRFDYYYGSQADQFSFIRIPRVMIKDPVFAKLSAYAKLLYSVLLDRMSLSSKNGWFDSANRVYIVYPISEVQDDLGIGKKKAMEVIAELVEFGLLEKKRRGQGLPSILYVKSFMTGVGTAMHAKTVPESSEVSETEPLETPETQKKQKTQKKQRGHAGRSEVSERILQEPETGIPEVSELTHQNSRESVSHISDELVYAADTMSQVQESQEKSDSEQDGLTGSEVSELALPEVSKSTPLEVPKPTPLEVSIPALLEVPKRAPLMSKTYNNYTYRSYQSHHINIESTGQIVRVDGMRYDRNLARMPSKRERGNYAQQENSKQTGRTDRTEIGQEDEAQKIQAYIELIRENIRYDALCMAYRNDIGLIDGIVELILETVLCKDSQMLISSHIYPTELVRSKFLKLDFSHIEYVIKCITTKASNVHNIKKYLLTTLFNASSTIDSYYCVEFNHDMRAQ